MVEKIGLRNQGVAMEESSTATTSDGYISSSPTERKIKKAVMPYAVQELRSRRNLALASGKNSVSDNSSSSTGKISSYFPTSSCFSTSGEELKDYMEIGEDPEQVESSLTTSSKFQECRNASWVEVLTPENRDEKSTVQIKMPWNPEIEEFFAVAEKDIQKRFTEKYNFDIAMDAPLKGRYEWIQ